MLVDNVKVNDEIVTFEPDTTLVIPLVAQTAPITSEITVRNPFNDPLQVSVFYTGANTTPAAGRNPCKPLSVPALGTMKFSLAEQCTLPSGSNFGYVTLTQSTGMPSPFQAFSRTENVLGIGYSVPAYPARAIEVPEFGHYVVGLKRQVAAQGKDPRTSPTALSRQWMPRRSMKSVCVRPMESRSERRPANWRHTRWFAIWTYLMPPVFQAIARMCLRDSPMAIATQL